MVQTIGHAITVRVGQIDSPVGEPIFSGAGINEVHAGLRAIDAVGKRRVHFEEQHKIIADGREF